MSTMKKNPKIKAPSFYYIFGLIVGLTLFIWILRGLGFLTFLPSSLIWILLFLSIATGIITSFKRR
jgi:apolipoprotein N-acyltransferase